MSEGIHHLLSRHIASVEQDVPSSRLHPLPVGGRMAYYTVANDSVELVQAVKAACDQALPYIVVGQGTSTYIHDDGFPGLVIHNKSNHMAFSVEHSQMVVDSGVMVQAAILQAAQRGLGGLIHLYRAAGTVGGALFYNARFAKQPIADSLRAITLLMPPTRMKPEPTIMRYKGSWLMAHAEPGLTRLQTLMAKAPREAQPVILTAHLQLTSLRPDELARRIQLEAQFYESQQPDFTAIGPLFADLPDKTAAEVLRGAEVYRLRHPGFIINRALPNYVAVRSRYLRELGGTIPLQTVLDFMEQIKQHVKDRAVVELQPAFLVH